MATLGRPLDLLFVHSTAGYTITCIYIQQPFRDHSNKTEYSTRVEILYMYFFFAVLNSDFRALQRDWRNSDQALKDTNFLIYLTIVTICTQKSLKISYAGVAE